MEPNACFGLGSQGGQWSSKPRTSVDTNDAKERALERASKKPDVENGGQGRAEVEGGGSTKRNDVDDPGRYNDVVESSSLKEDKLAQRRRARSKKTSSLKEDELAQRRRARSKKTSSLKEGELAEGSRARSKKTSSLKGDDVAEERRARSKKTTSLKRVELAEGRRAR